MPQAQFNAHDYQALSKLFLAGSRRLGLKTAVIGDACGLPVYLSFPANPNPNLKNLLIVAGMHGEEPAGPWAIVRFLMEEREDIANFVNISIIPAISPSGFSQGTRNNAKDQRTNNFSDKPSDEAKLFLSVAKAIEILGKDAALSLHENNSVRDGFYFYCNSSGLHVYDDGVAMDCHRPDAVKADLIDIFIQRGLIYFHLRKDGSYIDPQGLPEDKYTIKDGVVQDFQDEAFEDFLHRKLHIPIVVTVETPAKDQPINKRIDLQLGIVRAAANYLATDTKPAPIIGVHPTLQNLPNNCGGACLDTVLKYYGVDRTEDQVDDLCGLTDEGVDADMIVKVAKEFGLDSQVIPNCDFATLKNFLKRGTPVIMPIVAWGKHGKKDYSKDDDGHYVVAVGYDETRLYIIDPCVPKGRSFIDWYEFGHRWHDCDGQHIAIPVAGHSSLPPSTITDHKLFRTP